jgi:hypothetical protein
MMGGQTEAAISSVVTYLPAPCAESFAERMFSSGGQLAGNCSTETVEQRIQMRINSRVLEKHMGHQES